MTADLHVHTCFSADCDQDPRLAVESAIRKGVDILCFTDHMDYDFGEEEQNYTFDPDSYFRTLEPLKKEYREKIKILIGIEFGMQPHLRGRFEALLREYSFDYILGSQHLVYGKDPYYPDVFAGRKDKEVIERWFDELEESILHFPEISALAHIDYIFRYVQDKEKIYPYSVFEERIGRILKIIIENDIALEINSGGFRKIKCIPGFHRHLLTQYDALGGRRIVTGSDAHNAENIVIDFSLIKPLFSGIFEPVYTYYEKRIPYSYEVQRNF